jgi:hypothetical protein
VAEKMPWEIIEVDLVEPWKVKTPSGVHNSNRFYSNRSSNNMV